MKYPILLFVCMTLGIMTSRFIYNNADNEPTVSSLPISKIKLPSGFKISVFAENVKDARSMSRGTNGTLFVGSRDNDKVYALVDQNNDFVSDKIYTVASGLNSPNGVAFKDGSLFIGEINRISRIDNIEKNLLNPPKPVTVNDSYPTDGHHGWKFIRFGPDGKLYVPVGAPCNICDPKEPYASITRINADGTGREIFAKGIRNTVGFDWNPKTGELWFTDNGRDLLGDDLPSDELNSAPKSGMHFGYPYIHGKSTLDPEFGKGKKPENYTPAEFELGAHVASLGMRFYTGNQFPAEYSNQIFIAEHGSWNRSKRSGYRIVTVKVENGKAVSSKIFASGWMQNEEVWGRPVDIEILPDGSILVSDDYANAIYRISYEKK